MNMTGMICINPDINDTDKDVAFAQFQLQYPGIRYDIETDSFEWRGYKFNYFKSGLGNPDGFLLVDMENYDNWLFDYGDAEDRWNDFVARKKA